MRAETGTCDMHLLSARDKKNGTQELLAKVALCSLSAESDNAQKVLRGAGTMPGNFPQIKLTLLTS